MEDKKRYGLQNKKGEWCFRLQEDAFAELPDGEYITAITGYEVYEGIDTQKGKIDQLELNLQDIETSEVLDAKRIIISNQRRSVYMQLMKAVGAEQGKRFYLNNLLDKVIEITLTTKNGYQNITKINSVEEDFEV